MDMRVVLKSAQFSSTVFVLGSDAKSVLKECSKSCLIAHAWYNVGILDKISFVGGMFKTGIRAGLLAR